MHSMYETINCYDNYACINAYFSTLCSGNIYTIYDSLLSSLFLLRPLIEAELGQEKSDTYKYLCADKVKPRQLKGKISPQLHRNHH